MIAAGATERLEVVLDGNSAVYGADAVAGVVNIITRRDYHGAETSLRYGAGDGLDEQQVSQSFGENWGSGYAFITGEWSVRSDLARADRADILTADLRPYGRTDQRSQSARTPNLVAGVGANAPRYQFPATPTGAFATPGARYDGLEGDFLPEQKRINGFWALHQDVSEDVELWYEGFISRRRVITDGSSIGASFSVPRTNRLLPHHHGVSGSYRHRRNEQHGQSHRRVPVAPTRCAQPGEGSRGPARNGTRLEAACRLADEQLHFLQLRQCRQRPGWGADQQQDAAARPRRQQSRHGAECVRRRHQRGDLRTVRRLPPSDQRCEGDALRIEVRRSTLLAAGRPGARRRRRLSREIVAAVPGVSERAVRHEHAVDHERQDHTPRDAVGLR